MPYGTLYLCATPIGNLQDITLRVLDTLKTADLIACEDTRKTLQLLNHFSISKPVTSYYEHNKTVKGDVIIQQLKEGKQVALVSDAGMPGISDPGYDLIQQCLAEGIPFTVLPGAVAAVTGLVLSGLPTDRFTFEGFVPRHKKERLQFFQKLLQEQLDNGNHHVRLDRRQVDDQQVFRVRRALREVVDLALGEQKLASVMQELGVVHLARQTAQLQVRVGIGKQVHIQALAVHGLREAAVGGRLEFRLRHGTAVD